VQNHVRTNFLLQRSTTLDYNRGMTKPWWKEPTRAQWAAFAAAWVGWVLDAFDFTIYIVVGVLIAKEFDVGPSALAGSITLTLLVRLLGGWVAGWMADRWGRKLPLMISLLWFAVFDAAIYFAPSFAWIIALRTIFGFGMGAEWTAGTALAMEAFPARGRKFASGLLQAGWPVGFLLAAGISYFVVPAYGWRVMFLIAAVPALLVLPIRIFVPDHIAGAEAPAAHRKTRLSDLFVPGVRRMIVLGSLVMALGFIVYYGLTANYVGMLMTDHHLAYDTAFLHLVVFNVGMLAGVIACGWVANRWGVIAALVTPALLMVPALALYVGAIPGGLWIGAFLGGALGAGYSGVTPVLTTSLFPVQVRARAIGIVYHAGAFLAAFTPWLTTELKASAGIDLSTAIAIVVGVGLVAMSVAVLVLRHEIVPPTPPDHTNDAQPPAPTLGGGDSLDVPTRSPVELAPPPVNGIPRKRPAHHADPR
jgi:SHS family lactate transporter-like MFS transporter